MMFWIYQRLAEDGVASETFDIIPMINEMVTTLHPAISKNSNAIQSTCRGTGVMRAEYPKVPPDLIQLA